MAWSGEALAGLQVSRRGPEPVWVPGDCTGVLGRRRSRPERGVPSRGHSTAVAVDGCATEATATSFLPLRARAMAGGAMLGLLALLAAFLGACELCAGRRAFYRSTPFSPSHRCRSAQLGRYRHAPGSCCNPASDQAKFKPAFPACFQTEKWESLGMCVLKANTFLSRLKDKILFLMSGISPGL